MYYIDFINKRSYLLFSGNHIILMSHRIIKYLASASGFIDTWTRWILLLICPGIFYDNLQIIMPRDTIYGFLHLPKPTFTNPKLSRKISPIIHHIGRNNVSLKIKLKTITRQTKIQPKLQNASIKEKWITDYKRFDNKRQWMATRYTNNIIIKSHTDQGM